MPDADAPLPPAEKLPFLPRNKKFLIPIIILLVLTLAGLIGGLFIAFTALQRSEPFAVTMEALEASPEVELLLGSPIQPRLRTIGKIDEQAGVADLMFRVAGPDDEVSVRSRCEIIDDRWQVTYLQLLIGGDEERPMEELTLIGDPAALPQ